MKGMKMIVDIHVHLDRFNQDAIKETLEDARNLGIDKLGLCVIRGNPKYSYTGEEVKEIMDKHPEVVGFHGGSCCDPDGIEDLERSVLDLGLRGMKIHVEKNWRLEGLLACHALLRKAGELKIPVVTHPSTPTINAELAKACPETTIIFAHCGYKWEEAFQAAKPYLNACFDTSGYDAIAGVVERGVELLGPERIFFGSDVPFRKFASQLAKVQHADISKRDKRLILGENAARVINLR